MSLDSLVNEHDKDMCPHCKADLRGEPIPQDSIDAGYYGSSTHFSRMIGVEIRGAYDGVLFWMCPDCGVRWHRWKDERMMARAQPYIDGKDIG